MNFVSQNYYNVRDSIDVFVNYFGYEREKFDFSIGNSTETFYIGGDYRIRHVEISCVNGSYVHLDGRNSTNYSDIWYNHHYNDGSIDWEYGYNYGHYADASYDGLMTFAFACDKVNNDILEYYLLEKNRADANGSLVYDNGPMKAAYGSFLRAC